ncbi:MAG: hypothetical protein AB7S26_12350 [Sandaracinaceae bacterium]
MTASLRWIVRRAAALLRVRAAARRPRRGAWFVVVPLALALSGLASPARADRRFAVQAASGVGATLGGVADSMVVLRSPAFLDVGLSTWSDEDPIWWLGGSVRAEVENRASVAATLRVGLSVSAEILTARPYIGAAWFFAPFALFGPELGVDLSLSIAGPFAIFGRVYADAFFTGSDVPDGTVVVMLNGALGVEVVF